MGGFAGGGQANTGVSANVNERQQRSNEAITRNDIQRLLGNQSIQDFLIQGGPFQQQTINNSGRPISGPFSQAPSGAGFELAFGGNTGIGLTGELGLSSQRQTLARQLLGSAPGQQGAANSFGLNALGQANAALPLEQLLRNAGVGTFADNQQLNQDLTGGLGDFFSSGGAASQAQQDNISGIFDAQRDIGQSNLLQGFDKSIDRLQEQATSRGLRFGDTPIQDRGNDVSEELIRNLANLQTGISGQESAALLNAPLQQAQLGLGAQGQQQNLMQQILQSFSAPITQGFNAGNQFGRNTEFAAQFSPAAQAGPAFNNLSALFSGGNFSSPTANFAAQGFAKNPTFGQQLGQNFASSFGSGLGQGTASGIGYAVGGPSGAAFTQGQLPRV